MDLGLILILSFIAYTAVYGLIVHLVAKHKAKQLAALELDIKRREKRLQRHLQSKNEFKELADKYEWVQIMEDLKNE